MLSIIIWCKVDVKFCKAQLNKIIQSGRFLGSLGSLGSSKKCFSTIRNNSCCFSNRCRNSKKYMVLEQQL